MFPYIFIIIILLFGAAAEVFGKVKNVKIYFITCTILIALFAGLRYKTGADWSVYESAFYKMPELGNIEKWEVGYYWINLLFYYVFGNYYVLQFAASAFLLYSVARFFWKHTDYSFFSMLLFFMMFVINGILMAQVRQSIAVGIILFAYEYVLGKSFGKFICVLLLASLFHISAIFALPMWFMTRRIPNFVLISLILFFQIFYFMPEITVYVVKFFLPYMPERLEKIGNIYVDSYFSNKVEYNTGIYNIANVLLSIIVIYLVKNNSKEKSFFLNTLTTTMIIGALSSSMFILDRFKPYYLVYAIVTYSLIFELDIRRIAHKSSSLIMMLLIFCFFYIPFHARLTSKRGESSSEKHDNSLNPYYNVIYHPKKAESRKDWIEELKKQ